MGLEPVTLYMFSVAWCENLSLFGVSPGGARAQSRIQIGSHAAIIQGRVKAQGVWRLLICHLVEEKSHE